MKNLITAIALIVSMLSALLGGAGIPGVSFNDNIKYIYVSLQGSEDGDGSAADPVNSISKAMELVRLYNDDFSVRVNIGEGTYYIDDTVRFTPEDGGRNGHSVSYTGNGTVLSGGVEISGWTLHDGENNIYKAEGVDFDFAQLYVDGEKATRAISVPLDDKYSMRITRAYREETTEGGVTYPENSITIDRSLADDWSNLNYVKLKVLMAWTDNTLPVESVEYIDDRAVIKIQEPCSSRLFNRPHPDITGYAGVTEFVCFFENAYEFINEDGEWYLDRHTDTLYYKAPSGTDMSRAEVIAPKTQTLISVEGTADNTVKNLKFSGIDFRYSGWTRPNGEGLVGGQASQYVLTSNLDNEIGVYRTPAAVSVSFAKNVDFIGNTFRFLGATALDYHQGDKGGLIEGNVISDISGNGINIGKFVCDDLRDFHEAYDPADKREICDGQTVRNNYITRIGTDYEGAVGIGGGYPKNLRIEHNTLSFMPYSAVSVGYGWTGEDNAMSGNKIRYNHIHDVCLAVCDGAAVYTLSKQPRSVIAYNYIHDFQRHTWFDYDCAGIYLDEQTAGYRIYNNVMMNCPGIWAHDTGENDIGNNGEFYDSVIITKSGVSGEFISILPESEIPVMPREPLSKIGWKAEAYSTYQNSKPSNAFSDDAGTRWISGADQEVGAWFKIDMRKVNSISRIVFTGSVGDNPDFPSDCDILVSTDGKSWSTVSHVSDNGNVTIDVEFPIVKARYIKIVITEARAAWWDIRTVRVY